MFQETMPFGCSTSNHSPPQALEDVCHGFWVEAGPRHELQADAVRLVLVVPRVGQREHQLEEVRHVHPEGHCARGEKDRKLKL